MFKQTKIVDDNDLLLSADTLNLFVDLNVSMEKTMPDLSGIYLQELECGIEVIKDYEKEQEMMDKTRDMIEEVLSVFDDEMFEEIESKLVELKPKGSTYNSALNSKNHSNMGSRPVSRGEGSILMMNDMIKEESEQSSSDEDRVKQPSLKGISNTAKKQYM